MTCHVIIAGVLAASALYRLRWNVMSTFMTVKCILQVSVFGYFGFLGGDFLHLGIDTVEPRYCITRVKILFFTGQDLNPYFLAVSVPMFNLEENIHPSLFSTLISIAFCKFSPKSRGGVCSFASRESAC